MISMLILFLPSISSLNVVTIAGNGLQSRVDGQGVNSEFYHPSGVSLDTLGNIFVADAYNDAVRKINASRYVNTIATGFPLFFVTVDKLGNVYAASNNLNLIKIITNTGALSTYAGNGAARSDDGQGVSATFNNPVGISADLMRNIYVVDSGAPKVRRINATGYVSTIAGSGNNGNADGQGASASFNYPHGIVVDPIGNLYVADYNNHVIRRINSTGYVSTFSGSGVGTFADGQGSLASFNLPSGVALDGIGNIYVADSKNHRIRKINSTGYVSTVAGSGLPLYVDGPSTDAAFNLPTGVAVDGNGNVFVADQYNNRIRMVGNISYTSMTSITSFTITRTSSTTTLPASTEYPTITLMETLSSPSIVSQSIVSQSISSPSIASQSLSQTILIPTVILYHP